MNKDFRGMDVEGAQSASTTMGGGADQFEVVAKNLGSMVADLQQNQLWVGSDAAKFFDSFQEFLPRMDAAAGKLRDRAARLSKRAQFQIDASNT